MTTIRGRGNDEVAGEVAADIARAGGYPAGPHRKFYLLRALSSALGPDLARRELSCAELEAIAQEHGMDVRR